MKARGSVLIEAVLVLVLMGVFWNGGILGELGFPKLVRTWKKRLSLLQSKRTPYDGSSLWTE